MRRREPGQDAAVSEMRAAARAAEQDRNRRFIAAVGDEETVPLDLADQFGLTGREAIHIVETARTGSAEMKRHLFGKDPE